MYRNTNCTGLVSDGTGNGLTDPPSSIGTELESLIIVKFFNSLNEAQVALLDQIKEKHATAYIPFGNGDNKPQVGFRKGLLRFFTAHSGPMQDTVKTLTVLFKTDAQ